MSLCSTKFSGSSNVIDRSQYLPDAMTSSATDNSTMKEFEFENNGKVSQWVESSTTVNGQYFETNELNLVIDNGFGNWPNATFGTSYAELCPCNAFNANDCPKDVFTQMSNAEGPMGNDGLSNYRMLFCTQNSPADRYDCSKVFQNTFFNKTKDAVPASDTMVFGSLVGNTPVDGSKMFVVGEPVPLKTPVKPLISTGSDTPDLTHVQLYYLTNPDDGSVTQPCANSLDDNTLTGEGAIGRVFEFSPQHGTCVMRTVCENGICSGNFPTNGKDNGRRPLTVDDKVQGKMTYQGMPGALCYNRKPDQSDTSFPINMFDRLNDPTGLNGDPGFRDGNGNPMNIMNPLLLPFGNDTIPSSSSFVKGAMIRDEVSDFYNLVPGGYFYWNSDDNKKAVGDWDANYKGLPLASVTHVQNVYDNPFLLTQVEQWSGPQWSYDVSGAGFNPSTQVVSAGGIDDRAVRHYCSSMYGTMGAGEFCKGVNYTSGAYNIPLNPGNNVDFDNCTMPDNSLSYHLYSADKLTFSAVDCAAEPDFAGCMAANDPYNGYIMYNPKPTQIPIDPKRIGNATLLSPTMTHSAELDYFSPSTSSAGEVSTALQAFWPRSFRGNAGMTNPPGYDPKNNNNPNDKFIQQYYNGGQVCGSSGLDMQCPCYGCSYTGIDMGNTLP